MSIEIFTGEAPNFEKLITFDFFCQKCGQRMRMPVNSLVSPALSDALVKHYRNENDRLIAHIRKLEELVEMGNLVGLIRSTAKHCQ